MNTIRSSHKIYRFLSLIMNVTSLGSLDTLIHAIAKKLIIGFHPNFPLLSDAEYNSRCRENIKFRGKR